MTAAPVAAAGPGGAHFEGQVGAHYLLTMLAGGAPRGLPGTTISTVAFQRAGDHPLDDVVVVAHDAASHAATIEIQVKRSVRFTAGDPVFGDVVAQVVEAAQKSGFYDRRHELAVATARTSNKTDGPYQDVLKWARELGSASAFFKRLSTKGAANDDMRSFVEAFRTHVGAAGGATDDDAIWLLLRRFQILVFDYTATHSANEELATERSTRALHPDEAAKAPALWKVLTELAISSAASGGERDRATLITDLHAFRLAGDPRNQAVRSALAASARDALADIGDRVGDVALGRSARVAAVHDALDRSRYVEIRGDAGVGKSAILKHFADSSGHQAGAIVLSPNRTIPHGWLAMRGALGFEGGAAESLLGDVASDGAAILFIDNLDGFALEERPTVVDLVRAAAKVPGFAVVATCRRNFGVEEPSWLPDDARAQLESGLPVVIEELSDEEVEELSAAAPRLAGLLAEGHPARNVVRNLYRLARLARRPTDEHVPRTEVEMAKEWWRTADGPSGDDAHRERARTLRSAGEQLAFGADVADVSSRPAQSVSQLVASESFIEIRMDVVAFRHDVLREWAIANLITDDPSKVASLPTARPANASHSRGVDIAARMTLEGATDVAQWQMLLEALSQTGVHGSWRRAALLALVHSEVGQQLLAKAKDVLFANGGALLRELIRTVIAVDVEPASRMESLAEASGITWPPGTFFPSGPSWYRLILWLLKEKANLPPEALPEVVDIFGRWSRSWLAYDPFGVQLQAAQYEWLGALERAYGGAFNARYKVFDGKLENGAAESLLSDLRLNFKLCAFRSPELAKAYLDLIDGLDHERTAVDAVFEFRGTLAQAAPQELADLTAKALINTKPRDRRDRYSSGGDRPFHFIDSKLNPPAPAQGPFLELLNSAPEVGLSLIRKIVKHEVDYRADGKDPQDDEFLLDDATSARRFPWQGTYLWSRGYANSNAVGSALMALEAWGHKRIEAGDAIESVLDRVLQDSDPAAFVLVAVDLILSHWPKTKEAAVPFVGCPELLCEERTRPGREGFDGIDFLGLKGLEKEPVGSVTRQSLKERPSRRIALERLLGAYALDADEAPRARLVGLLTRAAERVGLPEPGSNFGDPRFMVRHALNVLDRANWKEQELVGPDGAKVDGYMYVAPPEEEAHLSELEQKHAPHFADMTLGYAIDAALEDPTKSSPEFAAQAVKWAQRQSPAASDDALKLRDQTVLTAAMIAMRDGSAELRSAHLSWALELFDAVTASKHDGGGRVRGGMRFNPPAIAFVGLAYVLKHDPSPENIERLLHHVGVADAASGRGFNATAGMLAEIDERLPRSVLRCAFAASVYQERGDWDETDEKKSARKKARAERIERALKTELSWLAGKSDEPSWPGFPEKPPRRRRRGTRLPGGAPRSEEAAPRRVERPERLGFYTDHQGAALWLRATLALISPDRIEWLRSLVSAYLPWTAAANGAGLEGEEEPSSVPTDWNDKFFALIANTLEGLPATQVDRLTTSFLCKLPDREFYDATTNFVRSLDVVYFDRHELNEHAPRIRAVLAAHMMKTSGWRYLGYGRENSSIEIHMGHAIATLFFNDYNGFGVPPACYLTDVGMGLSGPFLDTLKALNQSEQTFLQAIVTLNFLEVRPAAAQLDFALASAAAWAQSYAGNTTFWVDHSVGRRLCSWLSSVQALGPEEFVPGTGTRIVVDDLLAFLISLGVPEARALENALVSRDAGLRS